MREGIFLLAVAGVLGLALFAGIQNATDQRAASPPEGTINPELVTVGSPPRDDGGRALPEEWYDRTLNRKITRDQLPFFLRPYRQFGPDEDPLLRAQEVYRAIYETDLLFTAPSISFGGTVERRWTLYGGKEVRVVYTTIQIINGEYVMVSAQGPIYLAEKHPSWDAIYADYLAGKYTREKLARIRAVLSGEEFKKIDDFFRAYFTQALYDHNTTYLEYIRKARSKVAGKFGLESLDVELPWDVDPPITLAQVLGLEIYPIEEYAPDVLYFGPINAWGYCIAGSNIPVGRKPERRIAIHPQAVVFDWVIGKRSIAYHEIAHAIQSFPLFWYVDCELMNELLTNAIDVFELDFLHHSYLDRLRDIAYRHWSFDAEYAVDYVTKYKVGGIVEYDRDRFMEMVEKVHMIHHELGRIAERVYTLFYEDPLFWIALCDQMRDDAMILDLVAALMYEPTCINGSAEETLKWLRAHEHEIMEIGKKTLEEMRKKQRERKEELDRIPHSILAISWWNRLPRDVRSLVMDAYRSGGLDAVVELFLEGGDRR